ncbi:tigger transposable element-derived protein 1-like [Eriocheir sinensis]|uniref:tigger transposable element-derived protein 1-like n=2 Tax=Eriocheir sinensis TaxID=95602 RepID=UPI0021CA3076|nr:tigger transposable element-derived protein 1-like [Eriocheir sinensis]
MSEDRGGTAACGSKKPISVKGSRPERQGKKKRLLSMKEKGEVLKKLDTGMGPVAVGNFFNISESTVRGIRAKRIEIQRFLKDARGSSVIEVAHITHPTSKLMVTTEHYLKKYIEDKNDRNVCISSAKAREKAREIYAAVARKLTIDNPPPFSASSGWFSRFKKRHSLKRARCLGEAADAPTHEVESFTDVLKQLIEGGGYDLRQIFNADETGFHWKQQPRSTIIAKQKKPRGHKESKQRFSVLFTVNATGDCKLKPLVLYTAARPRPYRHKDMKNLNVHWVSNKKGYMTTVTFLDWFDNHFIPEGKEYCERNNLAFKLMLLLDNAPGHPTFLRGRHPNCEVVFLPPNTTSIIQPLDQEIIANVKLEFYRRTWKKLEEALDTDDILLQVEEEIDEPDQQTGDPSAELQVEEEIDEPDKQTGDPSAERQLQVDDVHVSDEPYGQTGVHPQAEVCMFVRTSGNATHAPFITTYDIVRFFFFNTSCCLG